jgi:hypothetical protein
VYLELALLRSEVMGDDDLAGRVRHLFEQDEPADAAVDAQLPPQEHLLAWAGEIFDQHLTWLANPGMLPQHPLLADGMLVWHMAQRLGELQDEFVDAGQGAEGEWWDHALPSWCCGGRSAWLRAVGVGWSF